GRGQLISLQETLEEQVTPLPQVRQATVGHPHPRTLAALAVRPHPNFDRAAVQGQRRTRPSGRHPAHGLPTLLPSLTPGCPTRPGHKLAYVLETAERVETGVPVRHAHAPALRQ